MTTPAGEFSLSISLKDASFSAQGETNAVLEAYEDFKKLITSSGTKGSTSGGSQKEAGEGRPEKTVEPQTDLPLKPFLAQLDLKGNKEKATAIVAWAAASGERDELKIGEIEQHWKKAPFKAPANLRRDVRTAEGEGWLHREGKAGSPDATYRLTGYGQQIIEGWKKTPSS